jgi:hypothetical protein
MEYFRKHVVGVIGLLMTGLVMVQSAQALILTVTPSVTNISVGDTFSVDIVASDLSFDPLSTIGAFDIDVAFDSSLLRMDLVTFGTGLNLGDLSGSLQTVTDWSTSVEVDEISFFDSDTLYTSQPLDFTLFTLDFTTLALGSSSLELTANSISDALASNGGLVPTIQNGNVNISNGNSAIPEPGMISLFSLGLITGLLVTMRRRKAAR